MKEVAFQRSVMQREDFPFQAEKTTVPWKHHKEISKFEREDRYILARLWSGSPALQQTAR